MANTYKSKAVAEVAAIQNLLAANREYGYPLSKEDIYGQAKIITSSDNGGIGPVGTTVPSNTSSFTKGITPISESVFKKMTALKKEEEEINRRKWFEKGLFEDGYQFGDLTKTILGTAGDVGENIVTGIAGIGETVVDTGAYLAPYAAFGQAYQNQGLYDDAFIKQQKENLEQSQKDMSEFIAKDLYNEEELVKGIVTGVTGVDVDDYSVLGEKMDSVAQSGGHLLAATGLQAVGVPWWVTFGTTSFGSEAENAFNQGATYGQAGASAAISAASEIISERLFGAISFGGRSFDAGLQKRIAAGISNKMLRTFAKLGVDITGEGIEEIVAQIGSNLGSSLYKDESIKELLMSEEAFDQYLESFIGGAIMGGVAGGIGAVKSKKNGVDYASGLTVNEQKVVDRLLKDEVAAREKEGKVTLKEKTAIYDSIVEDMDKGYIPIETIEEVLGGEAYTAYRDTADSEDAILREYEELGEKQNATPKDYARYTELAEKVKDIQNNSQRKALRDKLNKDVMGLVKGSKLAESYNERARTGQKFEADLTRYDTKQRTVVQKAIDCGILNNSRRTHEFVDFVAKLSADTGVLFDFSNTEKIREAGFSVEGMTVDGYISENGITVNIDSPKSRQFVVGHEITHALEGTELYDALRKCVFDYAKSKNQYGVRMESIQKRYKEGTDFEAELTADLVGEYIFSDTDFVNSLSTQNRNVFEKVFDEIKYLCKVATAGSKEARELEKVKRAFEKAYREGGKTQGDPDIRYSLSEVSEEQNQKGLDRKSEVSFSLSNDTTYMDKAIAKNNSMMKVDSTVLEETKALRERIAARMKEIHDRGLVGLPEDIEGNTYIANSSYDGTEENTTICPRSLASEAFVDAVSEYLGRPLSVAEQIYISQDLQGRSLTPECTYCYVATDRKAYRAFLGEYVAQRDAVLQKLQDNPNVDVSRSGELYKEFLDGRKDTNPMYSRFKMWVDAYKNGKPMIDASHLANINKLMGDINSEFGAELKPQIVDAMKYAQSASWAKKRVNYVAYNGHILKWKQDRINKLNSHYGLRMYSFSDFHPAFVLENMQMITDASVRGLKMLGYTKDTDFVDIFAPTGMNINVSTFGFEAGGEVFENNLIGAEWEKAKALREQYPNVGVTFVATNDTLVKWALAQDWIDVVIPYHLVRTGTEVAKAFDYTNYTSESSDTKTKDWKKGDQKYIAPTEHNNDKTTYLAALEKNHLKPKFERFLDNPNYMKLVNECRQPASMSKPVKPVFNEDAAMVALAKLEANGYYQPIGGSIDRMYEIAGEVADAMTNELAPVMSLSNVGEHHTSDSLSALRLQTDDVAPFNGQTTMFEPEKSKINGRVASVLTEESKAKNRPSYVMPVVNALVDKGMVFENYSLETGNDEVQAKWNSALPANTKKKAQYFMVNGAEGIKPLKSIIKAVKKTGKEKEFYDYMYHVHNIDRMSLEDRFGLPNKAVFGDTITAEVSRKKVLQYERANPEFKAFAEDVYAYNKHLRGLLVENGLITQETAELWEKEYPHYVPVRRVDQDGKNISVPLDTKRTGVNIPVKRATGGNSNIEPLFNTMAMRTEQVFSAIARNKFGIELKNTMGTTIDSQQNNTGVDEAIDLVEYQESHLLKPGSLHSKPTFTVFENGERVEFEITEDMYDALKPAGKLLGYRNKAITNVSNWRRNLLTTWNPVFALYRNPVKDLQDVAINSQHALKTYANIPLAIKEIATHGKWAAEYESNGGKGSSYFDSNTKKFVEDNILKQTIGFPIRALENAGEFIEEIPRLAEYIASRKSGKGVDRSMLDAARVTTNFAAGGDVTKFANAHGFTFLNASVQGASQHVRNFRTATKQDGMKGFVKTLAKYVLAGIPGIVLNSMLWGDDEEYEELSDYVKQNYYVVAKTDDGKFILIPKGRTSAVMQNALEQMKHLITGDDEADFSTFYELFMNNIAPNNPIENNILAPIGQAVNNEAWYGGDLVPSRLQKLPTEEQFDESTDALSRWLGENIDPFDLGPYKINYLLDQYSGGIGDLVLPMMTPEAESGDNSIMGNLLAPWKKEMTTDSVLNNQNPGDFYDLRDKLEVVANGKNASEEDKMKSLYLDSVSWDMGDLYAQKREIQSSNLPDDQKYAKVREIQEQINELANNALDRYNHVMVNGSYAEVGDRRYNYDADKDKWYEINATNSDGSDNWYYIQEQLSHDKLGMSYDDFWNGKQPPSNFAGKSYYAEYNGKRYNYDAEKNQWYEIVPKNADGSDNWYYQMEQEVTKGLGISYEEYWSKPKEYNFAYEKPGKYAVAQAIGGYDSYKEYYEALENWQSDSYISADKDANGKSISGSRKEKVKEYINGLDLDYGEKLILYRTQYSSKADKRAYNMEIIDYLNSRQDISYGEMKSILEELGMKVDDKGNITW